MTLQLTARPRLLTLRRLLPLAVLLVIGLLYVGPVEKYQRLDRQLAEQRHTLASLRHQHAELLAERAALHTNVRMILLARECGWILPGERPLVVSGTGDSAGSDCR